MTANVERKVGPQQQQQNVLQQGTTGPTVVLLHGLASLATEILHPLGGPLVDAGFQVIAIDRSGYGNSDPVLAREMGPAAQAHRLEQTLKTLMLKDIILVAHSAGAAPALHLARRSDSPVAGLVLLSPFCRPTRPHAALALHAAMLPWIGTLVRSAFRGLASTIGRSMVRAALNPGQPLPDRAAFPWRQMAQTSALRAMAAELRGFNTDMIVMRTGLKSLLLPTLVLMDPEDRVIDSEAHARWLTHRMPICAVRRSAAGHLIHHFDPLAVLDAVVSISVATQVGMRRIA